MSYCFNLFFLCYKAVVREQKILYFRSKLGLSYNIFLQSVGNVRKKSHLTSSLDRGGQLSLVKSAGARYAARKDLCSLGNELSELCNVLVINLGYLILAEDANLLSSVHRTECGTLSIVSFHFEWSITFPTHDFNISLPRSESCSR